MVVHASHLLEIDLVNFTNPTGQDENGELCDPDTSVVDTCDIHITIRVPVLGEHATPDKYSLGTFNDEDLIVFPTCGTIMSDEGDVMNPLTFTFPTTLGPPVSVTTIDECNALWG